MTRFLLSAALLVAACGRSEPRPPPKDAAVRVARDAAPSPDGARPLDATPGPDAPAPSSELPDEPPTAPGPATPLAPAVDGVTTQLADLDGELVSPLAADDTALYAITRDQAGALSLMRVPFATGQPALVAPITGSTIGQLIVADGTASWIADRKLHQLPLSGATPETITGGAFSCLGRRDRDVFYASDRGTLERVVDGHPHPTTIQARVGCNQIAVTDDAVIWLDALSAPPQRILRLPLRGGAAQVLAADRRVGSFAIAGDRIYYLVGSNTHYEPGHEGPTDEGDAAIRARPLAGGKSIDVVSRLISPRWFTSDGRYLYWDDNGFIARAGLDGTNLEVFASSNPPIDGGAPLPHDGALYWIDRSARIWVARPPR